MRFVLNVQFVRHTIALTLASLSIFAVAGCSMDDEEIIYWDPRIPALIDDTDPDNPIRVVPLDERPSPKVVPVEVTPVYVPLEPQRDSREDAIATPNPASGGLSPPSEAGVGAELQYETGLSLPAATPEPTVEPETSPTPEPREPTPPPTLIFAATPPVREFPDDIAIIYWANPHKIYFKHERQNVDLPILPLARVYKRDGVLVREELFSEDHPAMQRLGPLELREYRDSVSIGEQDVDIEGTPDGSRIVAALCYDTEHNGCGPTFSLGGSLSGPNVETELYESTDGGVTWRLFATLDGSFLVEEVTAGDGEADPQVLLFGHPVGETSSASRYVHWLYPSGDIEEINHELYEETGVLSDLQRRINLEQGPAAPNRGEVQYPERFQPLLWVSDHELLGANVFYGDRDEFYTLLADNTAIINALFGLSIYDADTDEAYFVEVPEHVFPLGSLVWTVSVQRGPFLLVTDVDGCLPLRAEPSPEAEELDCVAEGVLLQDQGDVIADEGITWHKARTPAGVVGWADGVVRLRS